MHRTQQPQTLDEDGVRFGRTLLRAQAGGWADLALDAVVLPANQRGLTGVNLAGRNRIDGGLDVERAVMSRAPLTLGTAVVTDGGDLTTLGVRTIVHAVVSQDLGDPPRELTIRQAVGAAMQQLDRARCRRVGLLPFGSGSTRSRVSRTESWPIMIEEMVGHLRRSSSRVEVLVMLCNTDAEVADVTGLLERIRRDQWGPRGY